MHRIIHQLMASQWIKCLGILAVALFFHLTSNNLIDFRLISKAFAADIPANQWVTIPVNNDPIMDNLNIPSNAAEIGMWSPVYDWPLNAVHNTLLPDGRLLSFGSDPNGQLNDSRYYDVWNPAVGFGSYSHTTTFRPQQQNSFCAAAVYLADGRLLIAGGYGEKTNSIFDAKKNQVSTPTATMADERWYATIINLADGRPIIMGGMVPEKELMTTYPDQAIAIGEPSMTPEVFENGQWRSLFGANSREAFGPEFLRVSYPRAWVAPNGLVFGISSDRMWYLDPNAQANNGQITDVYPFKTGYGVMDDPVNVGPTSAAVMYDIGKIIQVGGNGGFNNDQYPASNMATVIDISAGGTPTLIEQPRMAFARRYVNVIVLANGEVVATGGTTFGNHWADEPGDVVYAAEIWNPDTQTWKLGPNAAVDRLYHSFTTLLPNGAILSNAGGNPGPVTNLNAEVYYPPYLFEATLSGSQLAKRPVIKAISGLSYAHNAPIQLDMADSSQISGLTLLALSNGTHSFNSGQRRIPLDFTQNSIRLSATIPNANLTPPGYYQIVALNAQGVPSYGTIIAIGQHLVPPSVPTNPYTPPDLINTVDSVPIVGSDGAASFNVNVVDGFTYSFNFGDGSPDTPFTTNQTVTHHFANPGLYVVTLNAKETSTGIITRKTFIQAVATEKTALNPTQSTAISLEKRNNGIDRVWAVNPDNNSVSVISTNNHALIKEITVGKKPSTVAVAPDGRIWVANKQSATLSLIDPVSLNVVQTINLPRASKPHGLAFAPSGEFAYVALEATGKLLKLNPSSGAIIASLDVGQHARHIAMTADSTQLLVSRFITPPLPGESTATIDTSTQGGEVVVVNTSANMTINKTIMLRHSDKANNAVQASGIPNYLNAPTIAPDGSTAWLPSKQDNIKMGSARNGQPLNFQNTVRAITSNINMTTLSEDYSKRIDHDNSSVGSAAIFHPSGVYLFVALETSREVAVVDAIEGTPLFNINVGRAPQGLALSADGNTLYVKEFTDRSVSAFDLTALTQQGQPQASMIGLAYTVVNETLPANVLLGKQLFYDAKDSRLARDSYMSCASCHQDGGSDGRVWDFTNLGEGLRNTIALNGRAGMGHGFLHWSANFDEVQDFEKQIRVLAGGDGLMSDAMFNSGTVNQPLGDKKAGLSEDLDNLAAYVSSLTAFDQSPFRDANGNFTPNATLGKTSFENNCTSCHGGIHFTASADASKLSNIGTLNSLSGKRLDGPLIGIDTPTLLNVWDNPPYLHNGSAKTLTEAIQAHNNLPLNNTDLNNVVAYLQQVELVTGTGLKGHYYANTDLSGNPALQRTEVINFNWDIGAPAPNIPVDNFSIRWVGEIAAPTTGDYQFQTNSDDGVRVYIDGQLAIENWTPHAPVLDTSGVISLTQGQRIAIVVEYYEVSGGALMQLAWKKPSDNGFSPIPAQYLFPVDVDIPEPFIQGTLNAAYFTVNDLSGTPLIKRVDPVNFNWHVSAPDPSLPADNFSVRWSGNIEASTTGQYVLQTNSDDGVRVFINGVAVIDNWTPHGATLNDSVPISLTEGQPASILVEYYELGGDALIQLKWKKLTDAVFEHIPVDNLSPNGTTPPTNTAPTVTLTAPAANANFTLGDNIQLTANASDSDGISKVEFYDGSTLLNSDSVAPYSFTWENASLGTHALIARAFDGLGKSNNSAGITITVNNNGTGEPGTGGGLSGVYYETNDLSGSPVLQRTVVVNFNFNGGSPAQNMPIDNFSIRWTGTLEAPATGEYQLQTNSDDGVRVFINGVAVIDNWTPHGPTLDTSPAMSFTAGQRINISVEYQELGGGAIIQLGWKKPGDTLFSVIPAAFLYAFLYPN